MSIDESNDIVFGGSVSLAYDYSVIIDTIIFAPGDTIFEYLSYYESLEIGNSSFTVDTNNIFIAKVSALGDLKWVKIFQNIGPLRLASIDASQTQEINILGTMKKEDWVIGTDTLKIDTTRSINSSNIFILKINDQGESIWAKRYFEIFFSGSSIISDKDDNIIVTGKFSVSSYFNQDTVYSHGLAPDILMFKVGETGNLHWSKAVGDSTNSGHSFLLINNDNQIYISGNMSSSLGNLMSKYSPSGDLI